jgi:hypothetical protein
LAEGAVSHEHKAQREDAELAGPTAVAAGKRTLIASRYPALAQALGDRGAGGEPTIHDAATVAVEHKGGGAAVDPGVAERVGAHLGADFSGVRIHSDPLTQQATAAMGARAFAYGGDVFLGAGESGGDLGLMAHELTHVAQQGAAGQRAVQRAVQVGDADSPAEREADQVSAEVTGGQARPTALLVDGGPVGPGQMLKSQFLEQLRTEVTAAADAELGPIYSAIGCPYIDQYFGRYAGQPASSGEALLRRFAPVTRTARAAADMIPAVVARVREGARQWRDTGQAPPDLAAMAPAGLAAGSGGGAAAAQAQALRAPDGGETLASLEAELGPGQSLDGATASRMSDALGTDISSARIHTGPVAARKAVDAGALAFAVGPNVVMGASAPGAGTLEGDALLAHELAHTAQQAGAAADPAARRRPIGAESSAAEEHADAAAAGALAQLHGGARGGLVQRIGGLLKTGLQLQRCSGNNQQPHQPQQTPSIRNYADPSNAAGDPGRIAESDLRATPEFATLRGMLTPPQTEADAVMACRLAIRLLRQGQTVDISAQGRDLLLRAHEQLAAAGGAEGLVNQLNWVPFNSGAAASDPTQLESQFAQWMLVANTAAPSATSGRMNCWELVMFGAYRGGVITVDQLRAIYQRAVQNVRDGTYRSVGQTFEVACRAGAPVEFRLGSPDTPLPLRGDIVVFNNAPVHACIATGNVVQNSITGADEHEVISLWTPNGGHVERTTIETLARRTIERPILFWSARWD